MADEIRGEHLEPTAAPSESTSVNEALSDPESALLCAWLADRDTPCPFCKYNLRGVQSPVCPECGKTIELQIGEPKLPLGAWLTTLIASVYGSTVPVISVVMMTNYSIRNSVSGTFLPFLFVSIESGISPALVVSLLVVRKRFCRMNPKTQWAIAISAIALLLATVVELVTA